MKPLKAPKHSLEENEIVQELAELETRLRQTDPPTNTFEVRRRSFYEALASMWRQRLLVLQTGDHAGSPAKLGPKPQPEVHRDHHPQADRRLSPRLETDFDAELISPDEKAGPARILSVSRGGLAVAFRKETLSVVFPDNQVLPGSALSVRFQPHPDDSPSQAVKATGVVVWVQQVDEDQYRLGLRWG